VRGDYLAVGREQRLPGQLRDEGHAQLPDGTDREAGAHAVRGATTTATAATAAAAITTAAAAAAATTLATAGGLRGPGGLYGCAPLAVWLGPLQGRHARARAYALAHAEATHHTPQVLADRGAGRVDLSRRLGRE
jgi:hypothetical protein